MRRSEEGEVEEVIERMECSGEMVCAAEGEERNVM